MRGCLIEDVSGKIKWWWLFCYWGFDLDVEDENVEVCFFLSMEGRIDGFRLNFLVRLIIVEESII